MGYNLTHGPILRNKSQLDELAMKKQTLIFPTDSPKILAYNLREAVRAVKKFPEYTEYQDLKELYSFKEISGAVIAEFLGNNIKSVDITTLHVQRIDGARVANLRTIYPGDSLIDVLATMVGLGLEETYASFPEVILSSSDKLKLWGWTKESENIAWKFIDSGDKGITMTKDTNIPPEILWEPSL